jgi:hypothetical protein
MTFQNCQKDAVDINRVNAHLLSPRNSHIHCARGSPYAELVAQASGDLFPSKDAKIRTPDCACTARGKLEPSQKVRCDKWLAKDWWHTKTISVFELNGQASQWRIATAICVRRRWLIETFTFTGAIPAIVRDTCSLDPRAICSRRLLLL